MVLTKGILVAIEGIDGAGKTTQAEILERRLRAAGVDVVRTKEPTDGRWGRLLRESAATGRLSTEEELDAFLNDRREHVAQLIRPALDRKAAVIVDRYYFSTVAYQGARGLDPEELLARNEAFAPEPDLLALLEVEPAEGIARIRSRGDQANLFEREDNLRAAATIFAGLKKPYLLKIDARQDIEAVAYAIGEALLDGPIFSQICLFEDEEKCDVVHCAHSLTGHCRYRAFSLHLTPLSKRDRELLQYATDLAESGEPEETKAAHLAAVVNSSKS